MFSQKLSLLVLFAAFAGSQAHAGWNPIKEINRVSPVKIPDPGINLPGPKPPRPPSIPGIPGPTIPRKPEDVFRSLPKPVIPPGVIVPGNNPLNPIPRFLTNPGDIKNHFDKRQRDLARILDVAQDLVTFGEHGRKRDKERAKHEEDKARIARQGSENAHTEKVNGLNAQILDKNVELKRWTDFVTAFQQMKDQQESLIVLAQDRVSAVANQNLNIDMALQATKDANLALNMFVLLVRQAKGSGAMEAADVYGEVLETLRETLEGTGQTTTVFLVRAIQAASVESLNKFVIELSGLKVALEKVNAESAKYIQAIQGEKADLEKQLAELKK